LTSVRAVSSLARKKSLNLTEAEKRLMEVL
jgi:hypothetical protein